MEPEEAQKYPLFKNYEFALDIGRATGGGQGVLLIPKGDIFVPREYGFGELKLAPYIQEIFNEDRTITLRDLETELRDENELSLGSRPIGDMDWFLEKVINRFAKHGLIHVDRRFIDKYKLSNEDILSKGENYNTARVYFMKGRSENSFPDGSAGLGIGSYSPIFP